MAPGPRRARDRIVENPNILQDLGRVLCVFWVIFYIKCAYLYDAKSYPVIKFNHPHPLAPAFGVPETDFPARKLFLESPK